MFDVFVSLEDCMRKGTLTTQNLAEPVKQASPKRLQSNGCKYACTYCDYKISHKGHLRRHMRTHMDKPFICDVCNLIKMFYEELSKTPYENTHWGKAIYM